MRISSPFRFGDAAACSASRSPFERRWTEPAERRLPARLVIEHFAAVDNSRPQGTEYDCTFEKRLYLYSGIACAAV